MYTGESVCLPVNVYATKALWGLYLRNQCTEFPNTLYWIRPRFKQVMITFWCISPNRRCHYDVLHTILGFDLNNSAYNNQINFDEEVIIDSRLYWLSNKILIVIIIMIIIYIKEVGYIFKINVNWFFACAKWNILALPARGMSKQVWLETSIYEITNLYFPIIHFRELWKFVIFNFTICSSINLINLGTVLSKKLLS